MISIMFGRGTPTGTTQQTTSPRTEQEPGAGWRRQLLSHGSLYAVATIAPTLVGVAITPALTRSLGPANYGVVALCMSLIQLGQIVVALGLPSAIQRHVHLEASGLAGARRLVGFNVVFGSAVASCALLALAVMRATGRIQGAYAAELGCVLVLSASFSAFNCTQALVLALETPRAFVKNALFAGIIPASVGLACVLLHDSPLSYLLGFTLAHLTVSASITWYHVFRYGRTIGLTDLRAALRVGLPTVPHQLAGIGVPTGLVALTGLAVSASMAGQLQLSFLLGTAPTMLIMALNNSWAMQAYRTEAHLRSAYLSRSSALVAWLTATLTAIAVVGAPIAVHVMASPGMSTAQMVSAVRVAACAGPISIIYLSNIHQVFAHGRTAGIALSTPCSAVLSLTWAVALYSHFGFSLPTVASSLVVYSTLQSVFAVYLRKRTGMRELRQPLPILIATFAAMLAALFAMGV